MHKRELIDRLKQFVANLRKDSRFGWKGQRAFSQFLIYYLQKLNISHDERYDFWDIGPHLPSLLVEVFEELRTGMDETTIGFREDYESETGHKVPNILDLGASDILEQSSTVQTVLGFMMRDLISEEVQNKIDMYCNAQRYVLQQTFDKFLRLVYRRGLGKMVKECDERGMSGKFGQTELRTFIIAGRIMFTFARKVEAGALKEEWSVSFVGEDEDPLCLGAGLQSIQGSFRAALDMIEEVVKFWPQEAREQKKRFKRDAKVIIG